MLQRTPTLSSLSLPLIHQLATYSVLDHLAPGILLFRRHDVASEWYIILEGVVDISIKTNSSQPQRTRILASLVGGAVFGESIDSIEQHSCSAVVACFTKLLTISLRHFSVIYNLKPILRRGKRSMLSSKQKLIENADASLNCMAEVEASGLVESQASNEQGEYAVPIDQHCYNQHCSNDQQLTHESLIEEGAGSFDFTAMHLALRQPDQVWAHDTPTTSIIQLSNAMSMKEKLLAAANVLRCVLLQHHGFIADRDGYCRCMVGTQMVDWMLQHKYPPITRLQAVGMWQTLLEAGHLNHVSHEYCFMDKYLFYRWSEDEGVCKPISARDFDIAEYELENVINLLTQTGPDSLFTMVLQKPSCDRSCEELELVFEELVHVKALSHLSTMVKRELAAVIMLEQHAHAGTVLFNQGDEGKSWYIIFKGSVNVSIYGKGVVCTLHEGDDFGKLALINDAPRAATITLKQDNCQFLRVDKHDFNRILRDVEANTVRLKEHGVDVLILEKIPVKVPNDPAVYNAPVAQQHRYSVMAGTPEKMLEYLLETRIDSQKDERVPDTFQDDFILTHLIFMPTNLLCHCLSVYYHQGCSVTTFENFVANDEKPMAQRIVCKKRVVALVSMWVSLSSVHFFLDPVANSFIEELYCAVIKDSKELGGLHSQVTCMQVLMQHRDRAMQACTRRPAIVLHLGMVTPELIPGQPVMPSDECILEVHTADRSAHECKARLDTTAATIAKQAAQRMCMGSGQGVDLVEVKSGGERIIFNPQTNSVASMLSCNGRLFVAFKDQIDSLSALCEQDLPADLAFGAVDLSNASELAYHLCLYHWHLLVATSESELIMHILGRHRFATQVCTNLDLLMNRFNSVQYWTATQVLLCPQISKRVNTVKKLIKIAVHSKAYQDLLSFFAIVLGLSNVAVSRLQHTWDKLPTKLRKQFSEFECLLDPSRNHRIYRLLIQEMKPPYIPFIPLVIKDLTFSHEGNKSYFDGLVNFEKMHMLAQSLRGFRHCKSKPFNVDPNCMKHYSIVQSQIRNLTVIDNQRRLMHISYELEPPKHSTRL